MSDNINITKDYYQIKSESFTAFSVEYNLSVSIKDPERSTTYKANYRLYRNNKFVYEINKLNWDLAQWKAYFIISEPGSYFVKLTYYIFIRKGFWPFWFGSYHEKKEVWTVNFPFMTEYLDQFILEY